MFPDFEPDTPSSSELGLCKVVGAGIITDTHNAAKKSRSILIDRLNIIKDNWFISSHANLGKHHVEFLF